MGTLYVVRHAHAGSRGSGESDRLRPLSKKGAHQAAALVEQLADEGITRLVASPYTRCIDTLAPLAHKLGLPVETDERLAEAQGSAGAVELAEELRKETAVLCSHGDVIPDLLDALDGQGVRFDDELRWPKASTWVITRNGAGFTRGRFLPPPA